MHLFLYHGDEAGPARVYPKMLPFFQKQSILFLNPYLMQESTIVGKKKPKLKAH